MSHPESGRGGVGTLAGKTAFVTGGGTGLGLAVSRRLGRLGANVAVASRDVAHHAEVRAAGERDGFAVLSVAMDVREPDQVKRAVRETAERFGGLDVLVNNAAGNFIRPSLKLAPKAFATVVDIALNGVFYCSREAGRVMAAGRGGAIVNVSAPYASTGKPGVVHSACAKAGVEAMTRTLAAEWAAHRIRVNAVSPGPFESEGAGDRLWPSEEMEATVRGQIPLGRFGTAGEVADLVVWLASDAAAWVTGSVFLIDGGWSLPGGMLGAPEKVLRRRRPAPSGDAGEPGGAPGPGN
jgi:NAD(P)-dependent dehydrogenase (short-subunit alcohol dehydrogenase family)